MRIRKKLVIGMIMLAIACFGIGVMMTTSFSVKAETQGLTGFTSPGASVFIATDDTDTKQMRFQVNLDTSADKKYQDMAANQSLQSGVVVLPYDIYQAEGYTELTKDTEKAVTADVTKNWTANENGYESYAYLPADLIPQDQYNRTLIARGYIVDGENVYYTEPVRASMAYVAWQNLGMEGGAYNTILRSYMGPYTLTYGAGKNEKIENLYYGDALSLPTNINGYDVEGWFWDEDCTNAIASTDYATGSMSVYYKFREFTVSGTVSCADSVDLTTVGILVDGVETDATVDASGAYSLIVEEGTHDFTFFCAGYKAYALNTTVSGNSTLNAELKSDFYEIGNFGNVASTPNLVPEDDFDGQYTVEGKDYLLIMPNTATTDGFTYTVTATGSTLRERGDKAYAASVSNGTYVLSVGVYEWETLVVNLNTQGGAGYVSYYDLSGIQRYGANVTIEMVRTASDIKVYIGGAVANSGALYFTFTSTGITLADGVTNKNWVNTFETEGQSKLAGFFGESVSLACGVANLNGAFEATYTCAVVNRAVDGTWRVGNFGTVQSNTPAFNENGEYTISGANQLVLFPNTATSTPFTYTVAVSNVTRTEAKTEIGISLTDGNYKLTVGYRAKTDTAPTAFSLGITTEAGQSDHAVYLTEDDFGEEVTLKFVVTKESIQFYCGENKLIFSFMKDSCVSNIGNPGWTSNNLITNTNGVTDAYKTRISGFFAENAKIAVGINSGLSTGSATATYQCSITKN